jgi:hypothetical protein
MAQEAAAAPLLLDWSQGEKSGTVTVDHGTKASGLHHARRRRPPPPPAIGIKPSASSP